MVARSASISPTTLQNLKPWPEKPQATLTCAQRGWVAMTKWQSGVFVYMQVTACRQGPDNPGMRLAIDSRIRAISVSPTVRSIVPGVQNSRAGA